MIDIDWNLIGTLNGWQTILTIAVIIIALFILIRFAIRFWPWLRKVVALFEALGQLPVFITTTNATLARQDATLLEIKHEVLPNRGGSLRDAVDGQGKDLAEIKRKLAKDNDRIRELEQTQPPHAVRPRRPQNKKESP